MANIFVIGKIACMQQETQYTNAKNEKVGFIIMLELILFIHTCVCM